MDEYDWTNLAFGNKSELKQLKAIFIAAPREISRARFTQLVKEYLPKANIVLGISKEPYVLGLEGQSQFAMLKLDDIRPIIEKVNQQKLKHTIAILKYSQRELKYILEKITPSQVVLIRGSWYYAFHYKPEYYVLANKNTRYQMLSPFVDEAEALKYASKTKPIRLPEFGTFTAAETMDLVNKVAGHSYDYAGYQTGAIISRKKGRKYQLIASAHNIVVPFETYAMHYGAAREINFSPMQDLNHYDTIHAEMSLLLKAIERKLDLKNTSLFINLLPCPTCARILVHTDIAEFIYGQDHSDGYAIKMLQKAGKNLKRLIV